MFAILWRFRPAQGQEAAFEAAYGPGGDWARLFRTDDGFVRTDLLRGTDGGYLSLDLWRDEGAFAAFQEQRRAAYEALDRRCEALTECEEKIGTFTLVGASE